MGEGFKKFQSYVDFVYGIPLRGITFVPWYHVMSGGGAEYRLISHVRLSVLPAFTKTADSPSNLALAAERKKI